MRYQVDLTPFGFTRTESQIYAALLKLGPSTGYAVAHAARIARANSYGALEGLVSRGAALRLPGRPARYRPTDPPALIAQLATRQGEALDRLAAALSDATGEGEADTRSVVGARALTSLIMHLVARAEHRVQGILGAELVRPTLPAWRRAKERAVLDLRIAGEPPVEAESLTSGAVPAETPTALLIDDAQAVLATGAGELAVGLWSSHPAVTAVVRAALGEGGGLS
jgi:sugar-specific transcriptional regulator TrmB